MKTKAKANAKKPKHEKTISNNSWGSVTLNLDKNLSDEARENAIANAICEFEEMLANDVYGCVNVTQISLCYDGEPRHMPNTPSKRGR